MSDTSSEVVALPWVSGPMAALDFETTGVDPHTAEPVSASIAFHPHRTARIAAAVYLIDTGCEIPEESTLIHGIERRHVRALSTASDIDRVAVLVARFVAHRIPIVMYNGSYDWPIFLRCVAKDAQWTRSALILDPWPMFRHLFPELRDKKVRKLGEVYRYLFGEELVGAHGAGSDAIAALRIARRLCALPEVRGETLENLQLLQANWSLDDQRSYLNWQRSKPDIPAEKHHKLRTWPLALPFREEGP